MNQEHLLFEIMFESEWQCLSAPMDYLEKKKNNIFLRSKDLLSINHYITLHLNEQQYSPNSSVFNVLYTLLYTIG